MPSSSAAGARKAPTVSHLRRRPSPPAGSGEGAGGGGAVTEPVPTAIGA